MEFRAEARYMRVSPQKARLVLDLIKGQRVEDALNTLVFTKKRVAATVEKLLRSALENANYLSAEKNLDVDVDSLYVQRAVANDGPRMKRIRPAPMGRAFRYVRRISHIEIALAERTRGKAGLATVVGEEPSGAGTKAAARPSGKAKAKHRALPAKTKNAKRQNEKKFAGKK
jgi:large subunit ribosomal protein L22